MAPRGVGEGPRLVTEQLGLEYILGQGRAVDFDQRAVGARAAVMQDSGGEPLAGARVA